MTASDCPPGVFRFGPGCGGVLDAREVHHHSRLVCRDCGRVLYRNPAVGVAVVVRRGEELLFGRRTGGPYRGAWCLPCGDVHFAIDRRVLAELQAGAFGRIPDSESEPRGASRGGRGGQVLPGSPRGSGRRRGANQVVEG